MKLEARRVLAGSAAALTLWVGAAAAQQPAVGTAARNVDTPPNVLLILADDLGWADLGVYGSTLHRTPNLDRLAREGVRFTTAYAASSVCSPTRASILTGRHPARIAVTDWIPGQDDPAGEKFLQVRDHDALPLEEVTIAELLAPAGYVSGHIGKWHLGGEGYLPTDQGFDVNVAGTHRGSPPSYFYPYGGEDGTLAELIPGGEPGEYLTDRMAEEAEGFIRRNSERPFFLHLSFYTPHTPLQAPEERVEPYRAAVTPLEREAATQQVGDLRVRVRQTNPVFAAMVESLDRGVGRVLRTLEEEGIAENTLVIFISDNGGLSVLDRPNDPPTSNRPLRAGKGWLYEGGVRIPMIVRWPGEVRAGRVSNEPVSTVDLLPTIAEATRVPAPPAELLDGVSLLPVLREAGALGREALHWHYPHYHGSGSVPSSSIRVGEDKAIEWLETGRVELYDLGVDPYETTDLAPRMPARAAELRERLARWREAIGAPMPRINPETRNPRPRSVFPPPGPAELSSTAVAAAAERERPAADAEGLPNIVFIMADDLGWRDVGFMGSRYYETPRLDRLAREGMVFTAGYANAPNCAPTRASLMTGQYSPRHGIFTVSTAERGEARHRRLIPPVNQTTLDLSAVTIAEGLRQAGYVSASIGKWHLGEPPEHGPVAQGFDLNVAGYSSGSPRSYFSPYRNPQLVDGPEGEHLTDRLATEAIRFIDENADRPFFLYLPFYAVHTPLQGRPDLVEKYRAKRPVDGQDDPVYAAMVEAMDMAVGRVLDALDERGLAGKTIVVFTSDNGGHGTATSNEPLRGSKGMLYEGGVRVPLVVRWPGVVAPGSRSHEPVISLDWFPTLLEITNSPPPAGQVLDGENLVPVLRGGGLDREAIFWHFPAYLQAYRGMPGAWRTTPAGSVRRGSWKLIEFFETGAVELYDLGRDPGETTNLADRLPDRARELRALLARWRAQVGAVVPETPNPAYEPTS